MSGGRLGEVAGERREAKREKEAIGRGPRVSRTREAEGGICELGRLR